MLSIMLASLLIGLQRGEMPKNVAEFSVTVVSVLPLSRFEGEAILTHFDPKYVVGLMLNQPKTAYSFPETDVILPTHMIVFVAVHSVAQVFRSSGDIVGESFRIRVEMTTTNGRKTYKLTVL